MNEGPDARDLSAPPGALRLPARKCPWSDLSERPVCASQDRFRGGAPAPSVFRPFCAGRPARPRNSLPDKAFRSDECFAGCANRASNPPRECCADSRPSRYCQCFLGGPTNMVLSTISGNRRDGEETAWSDESRGLVGIAGSHLREEQERFAKEESVTADRGNGVGCGQAACRPAAPNRVTR